MRIRGSKRPALLVALVPALCLAGAAIAVASSGSGLEHKLLHRDPGARVDGNTIVLTGKGGGMHGVPDRPNFIIGLGPDERIVGSHDDQLGSLGEHDTVVAGSSGHEFIVGGPHATLVVGGSGHDLVIDTHADAAIDLRSKDDEVMVSGHDDKVFCSGDSFGDKIDAAHGDTVSKTCRNHHDSVGPASHLAHAGDVTPVAHAAAGVSGDGSNFNPFLSSCDDSSLRVCTVSSFPWRRLDGFWANEYVPAYKCPPSHPYLDNHDYGFGTVVPHGVEIQRQGEVGVTILGTQKYSAEGVIYAGATKTEGGSSATNWTFGSASYKVVLHCSSNAADSYS